MRPWPWYVAGPVIGLFPAFLLLLGNRPFGVSSTLRHVCAAACPGTIQYFRYDWRRTGGWNLAFTLGILIGGFLAGSVFANPDPIAIASETRATLRSLGVERLHRPGAVRDLQLGQSHNAAGPGVVVGGGFAVGFGAAYAGGCTSGHGLSGIADLQRPSAIALMGFFAGGIAATFLVVPFLYDTSVLSQARPGARAVPAGGDRLRHRDHQGRRISWFRMQEMFSYQGFHMFGIFGRPCRWRS